VLKLLVDGGSFRLMRNRSGKVNKWFDLELLNSFAAYSPTTYLRPGCMLDEIGFVHLRGAVTHASNASQFITLLPPIYRPERSQHDTTIINNGSATLGYASARLYIAGPTSPYFGKIKAAGGMGANAGWINLSGCSWWVGKERLRQL
jgi:hypothetical protein